MIPKQPNLVIVKIIWEDFFPFIQAVLRLCIKSFLKNTYFFGTYNFS